MIWIIANENFDAAISKAGPVRSVGEFPVTSVSLKSRFQAGLG